MLDDMLHVMQWHNGEREFSPFSDAEMTRRQDDVRRWMAENDVDAALFTSDGADAARGDAGRRGYRQHDILIIREDDAENITGFPFGPEHNIIRN